MKYALNIGPVVTAIMASSPIFRSYSDGVIDDHSLCVNIKKEITQSKIQTKPNHAVLVVGYGQEKNPYNGLL